MITVIIDHGITTRRAVAELDEARRGSADDLRLLLVLVPRAAPLAWLVQALQMQRLRGIHMYRVEASYARLLGPRVQHKREEWRLGMI